MYYNENKNKEKATKLLNELGTCYPKNYLFRIEKFKHELYNSSLNFVICSDNIITNFKIRGKKYKNTCDIAIFLDKDVYLFDLVWYPDSCHYDYSMDQLSRNEFLLQLADDLLDKNKDGFYSTNIEFLPYFNHLIDAAAMTKLCQNGYEIKHKHINTGKYDILSYVNDFKPKNGQEPYINGEKANTKWYSHSNNISCAYSFYIKNIGYLDKKDKERIHEYLHDNTIVLYCDGYIIKYNFIADIFNIIYYENGKEKTIDLYFNQFIKIDLTNKIINKYDIMVMTEFYRHRDQLLKDLSIKKIEYAEENNATVKEYNVKYAIIPVNSCGEESIKDRIDNFIRKGVVVKHIHEHEFRGPNFTSYVNKYMNI